MAASSLEDCTEVQFVNSCVGAVGADFLVGFFELFEGECPGTGGRPAYYNSATSRYLYYATSYLKWLVASGCGTHAHVAAMGGAGWYPFENTASLWQCATSTGAPLSAAVSIECSTFEDALLPCISGSYETSGEAIDGECR